MSIKTFKFIERVHERIAGLIILGKGSIMRDSPFIEQTQEHEARCP